MRFTSTPIFAIRAFISINTVPYFDFNSISRYESCVRIQDLLLILWMWVRKSYNQCPASKLNIFLSRIPSRLRRFVLQHVNTVSKISNLFLYITSITSLSSIAYEFSSISAIWCPWCKSSRWFDEKVYKRLIGRPRSKIRFISKFQLLFSRTSFSRSNTTYYCGNSFI